jgi:4-hydroxybenzoate polyprenyltransferase
MGPNSTRILNHPRSAWRAHLLLARVSNLPTVWTNVLAGLVASGAPFSWHAWLGLSAAVSLLYTGGMYLNDAFDADVDTARRADRPIPAGDVARTTVFAIGFVLLAGGTLALVLARPSAFVAGWSGLLVAAIIYYDVRHKRDPSGPLVMGVCRGLVYCVAAVAVSATLAPAVLAGAALVTGYVIALTWVAKRVGPRAGSLVSTLIAGISLVDAGVVLACGSAPLAALAASGFVLTLVCQRAVPGD